MKKIAIAVLAALPVFAVAQQPAIIQDAPKQALEKPYSYERIDKIADQVKQLKQENATLRIQITGLQNSLLQAQAQEAAKNISEAHKQAVKDLEALNPGMKWDEQQGKLVKADAGK